MASSPKQPKPIDPEVAAAAQARWSRTGTKTPFGSVEWDGNNQVVTPSDDMMGLFNRAMSNAGTESERFKNPSGFSGIRDATQSRLAGNQYNAAFKPGTGEHRNLAKDGQKETPFRDAFFGERDSGGDRHTMKHIMDGGLEGSIQRGIRGTMDARNAMPGPIKLPGIRQERSPASFDRMLAEAGNAAKQMPPPQSPNGITMGPNGPMINGQPLTPDQLAMLQGGGQQNNALQQAMAAMQQQNPNMMR